MLNLGITFSDYSIDTWKPYKKEKLLPPNVESNKRMILCTNECPSQGSPSMGFLLTSRFRLKSKISTTDE